MIFTAQLFRGLPPTIRANAGLYLLWGTTNAKELKKMEDEFGGVFPDFLRIFTEATREPYHFLTLVMQRQLAAYADFGRRLA